MTQTDLARGAYETHLSAAQALAAEEVRPYRIDPDLAIINIKRSMGVLTAEVRAKLPQHLPRIELAGLDALPSLALAVKAAALYVDNLVSGQPSPSEMIAEGWKLRSILMPVVAGFAAMGLIPEKAYENIVRGTGVRDMAGDCVALAEVFHTYQAAIAGKHPVEPAMLTRTARVGSWLLQNLSKRTAVQPAEKSAEADIRDRMATLLVLRHQDLRAVAYYFHGDDFSQYVPLLMSRRAIRSADAEPDAEPEAGSDPSGELDPAS